MSIKLIAIDLDGTIVKAGTTQMEQVTVDTIRKAMDKGIKVCVATGRTYDSLLSIYKRLGLSSHIISTAGATINDKDGNILYKDYIAPEKIHRLFNYLNDNDMYGHVYQGKQFQYYDDREEFMAFATLYEKRSGLKSRLDESILVRMDVKTPKAIIMTDLDKIEETKKQLRDAFPELSIRDSMTPYIEAFEHSASKGTALNELVKIYGVKIEETMAIGDTGIDLCMIKEAGIGVAMGDSAQEIRDAADYVTKDFDQHGAAYAIEKFCL